MEPLIVLLMLISVVLLFLPVVSVVMQIRLRDRVRALEDEVVLQRGRIDELSAKPRQTSGREERTKDAPAATEQSRPVVLARSLTPPTRPPTPAAPPVPRAEPTAGTAKMPSPVEPPPPVATAPPSPPVTPRPPAAAPPPPEPPMPPNPLVPFDWESVVGVKMFSSIAGVALVLAAILFLRYSIDRGWLSPTVRVAIGIVVSVTLLVVCERRAARRYRITANALDAAAIAILFSTFFSAHTLWHLIPATVAFALLALVTVVAVLLSIRHDSLFIAVLGLVGGFATPALLSTGENRPISLFTYLLLLNVGLSWVASRKKWPALTILTVALTAIYQWAWVRQFLDASQLSLAMGIFVVFAIASFVGLSVRAQSADERTEITLARAGLAASGMPLVFVVYLAAVPGYGAHAALLFGFLLLIDSALLVIALARKQVFIHEIGAAGTLLVFTIWLAVSYTNDAWTIAVRFTGVFVAFYALAPMVADRINRPFSGAARSAARAAPILLFTFVVLAGAPQAAASPGAIFGTMFALMLMLAWRALASSDSALYFIAAFFGLAAEGAWSAAFLTSEYLGRAISLYAVFGAFYLGVPIVARGLRRRLQPAWAAGVVQIAGIALLLFIANGPHSPATVWGLALLLAILDAGLFIESASYRLPTLSLVGGVLSWVVLSVWWRNSAAVVGLLPSLLVLVGLSLTMLGGHAWVDRLRRGADGTVIAGFGFRQGIFLGLVGHVFLFFVALEPAWMTPPWPLLGALTVVTLATSAASLAIRPSKLHAVGLIATAVIVLGWTQASVSVAAPGLVATEAVAAYGLLWQRMTRRVSGAIGGAAAGAVGALFVAEISLVALVAADRPLSLVVAGPLHVMNLSILLALAWQRRWEYVAPAAVIPAWLAAAGWHARYPERQEWTQVLGLTTALYATFMAYPFVLNRRVRESRMPHLTAVLASALLFTVARQAFVQGGVSSAIGIVPVVESAVLALLLRHLLRMEGPGERDLGRLAVVAGAALAFATVAIPLQLKNQWITIGWALEGAALTWLYQRVPHQGLLYAAYALLGAVFVRLALNPSIFVYEPHGMRVFNWYLYTYLVCAVAMLLAASWLSSAEEPVRTIGLLQPAKLLASTGVILLFILLNIEIADFYATGPEIMFRVGVSLAQDLTYTIGWLAFALGLLTAGIWLHSRATRVTAVALTAVTTFKAFLYDLGSLGGLYRVASLVGLAVSLALVAVALQKFVLQAPKEASV